MRLFATSLFLAVAASNGLLHGVEAKRPENSTATATTQASSTNHHHQQKQEQATRLNDDDKSIQKRVGQHATTETHYYREQPVVYQRTMIRNPEDAFTQTIRTNFQCPRGRPGYYADVENGCRVFHICHEYTMPNGEPHSVKYSQFCPAGTIFDQLTLTCNFEWSAVPCGSANQFFYVNTNLYQADAQFISDADIQRGRSLNSGQYRSYETERYYAPQRSVTYSAPAVTYSTPARPVTYNTPVVTRNYETTSYVSRPAVTYQSGGSSGGVHYDTHTVTRDGGHSDVHVERSFVEPRTKILRPAVNERLEIETPPRVVQRVVITPPSHTHHVHSHRPETPKASVHPAQVSLSSYAPHMEFLGFVPVNQHYNVASRTYRYEQNRGPSSFHSYDSRHQGASQNAALPRSEVSSEIVPPRYVSEQHHRSFERSHQNSILQQRPLIPASEFPGFRQNAYRSSLSIRHDDPHGGHHHSHHDHHHHHGHHGTPAITAAPTQRPPAAVPVVPVTTERRPSSRTVELVEELVLDKARRPAAVLNQYDSRHDYGRRIPTKQQQNIETTVVVQEPVVVRGGRRSKTLIFPDEVAEVPYLKRTARSHKEFVEPAFKGASAIPGIIPTEYLQIP